MLKLIRPSSSSSTTHTTLTTVIKSPGRLAMFKHRLAHNVRCCLLELMHTTVSSMHATLTTLPAAVNSLCVSEIN